MLKSRMKLTKMWIVLILSVGWSAVVAAQGLDLPYAGSVSQHYDPALEIENEYQDRVYVPPLEGPTATDLERASAILGRYSYIGPLIYNPTTGEQIITDYQNIGRLGGHAFGVEGICGMKDGYGLRAENTAQGGTGLYAIGGTDGFAGLFKGDIKIVDTGRGIIFPDGTKQTTAGSADADNDWQIDGDDMYSIPSGRVGIGVTSFPSFYDGKLTVDAGAPGPTYAVKASCVGVRTAIRGESKGSNGKGVEGTAEAAEGTGGGTGVWGYSKGGNSPHGVYGVAEGYNAIALQGEAFGEDSKGVAGKGEAYDFYAFGPGVNYGSPSSIRWKTDIREIDEPLEKILRLRGVFFNWDQEHGGKHDIGMIAEEVGEIIPEIVQYESNSEYTTGMDYSKLTPLLIEAVKALKAEVDIKDQEITQLKERVLQLESLTKKNTDLLNQLGRLEAIVTQTTHLR